MHFLVITHVVHKATQEAYLAYGPYVREMNIWLKYAEEVQVVAPLVNSKANKIEMPYQHQKLNFQIIPAFNLASYHGIFQLFIGLPTILFHIYQAMRWADHIHLRCPGNIGLLGCIMQIAFPYKTKTAKYAGNWDPASKQPWSYRLQQWILNNTFLTRNMTVLVYGSWSNTSKNIKPFFTASYSEQEIVPISVRMLSNEQPIRLIFVGGLHKGKRPLLAVQVAQALLEKGILIELHLYGEGQERKALEGYIQQHDLTAHVILHGNVDAATVKQAYRQSHFLVFASQSEGWPKVVAEAMFWGCVPITTAVSCVPEMVGFGKRGDLVEPEISAIVQRVEYYLQHPKAYQNKATEAMDWSRQHTLEKFETEIAKLL